MSEPSSNSPSDDEVGNLHTVPIQDWIKANAVFKFWGDNVDKQRYVRDYCSDQQGQMMYMYSILVGRSCTSAPELQHIQAYRGSK